MTRLSTIVIAIGWLIVAGGCGPSVWERSFSYEPGVGAAAPTLDAMVRSAPWARIGAALEDEGRQIAESDTHRDDWSADEVRTSELKLLRALQLPTAVENAQVLGRSHFKTTRAVDPADGELARFAASVGADYAIWSSQPLGKAETIEREAISRDRWRWQRIWDADRDRFIYVRRWEPETVWVPVVVERDEVRWMVFYVRRR